MAEGLSETLASYDANAAAYAEAQWSTRLVRQMDHFRRSLSGPRVLDLGCGPGRDVEWLDELGHDVIGVDLSTGMLAEARRRSPSGRFVQGDVCALPLPASSFDGVWSCSVFVHLDREQAELALAEIVRVLRAGGTLYLGLEQGGEPEWRSESSGHRRLYRFWQPEELAAAMANAGLTMTEQYVEHVDPFVFLTTHATTG